MATRVCVIGAGMSGLTAMKALRDREIEYDCFERRADVGGLWKYSADPQEFSVYDACYTISCKHWTGYGEFPMPDHYPEYLHHPKMHAYFASYADTYSLRDRIHFGVSVEQVARNGAEWRVRLSTGETRIYSHVIVATGQFGYPVTPKYPGQFSGRKLHSAEYKRADDFMGENVLVVGLGNSGADIACDLSRVARTTYLSTRESAHVIPKYVFGQPFLHLGFALRLPMFLLRPMTRAVCLLGRGTQASYDFPAPSRRVLLKNPTISSSLLDRVGHGSITMKPALTGFTPTGATFADGSSVAISSVIFATGFEIRFPFFDKDVLSYRPGKFRNFGLVANLDHDGLYFIGFANPLGTYAPLAERQARWVAGLIAGDLKLPTRESMEAWYERHQRRMSQRFEDFDSPMINVDFFSYKRELERWARS